MKLIATLILLLIIFSCNRDSKEKIIPGYTVVKSPDEGRDVSNRLLPSFQQTYDSLIHEKGIGVFQRVDYLHGEYQLDTWIRTEFDQGYHKHNDLDIDDPYPLAKRGWSWRITKFPYDSLVSGSFEYIKEIKQKQRQGAEVVFNQLMESMTHRVQQWIAMQFEVDKKKDSIKFLNDLK